MKVTGFDIFRQSFCCSCCKNNKDNIIESAVEFTENSSEIGGIITLYREIELIKKILLRKQQREIYSFPSISIVKEVKEVKEAKEVKSEEDKKEEPKEQEDELIEKLKEECESLKDINLEKRENKILAKNIITSII